MVDLDQLERSLDLWASMWEPHERVSFERALERVLLSDVSEPLQLAALAACQIIATPRLLGAAGRAGAHFDPPAMAAVTSVAMPLGRIRHHEERLRHDKVGVYFLLEKSVLDPSNPVADKMLDRVDVRDLYAVMQVCDADELRVEAARRIARRGPHQRARLLSSLQLDTDAFEDWLAVDVPLDDLVMAPWIDVPLDGLRA